MPFIITLSVSLSCLPAPRYVSFFLVAILIGPPSKRSSPLSVKNNWLQWRNGSGRWTKMEKEEAERLQCGRKSSSNLRHSLHKSLLFSWRRIRATCLYIIAYVVKGNPGYDGIREVTSNGSPFFFCREVTYMYLLIFTHNYRKMSFFLEWSKNSLSNLYIWLMCFIWQVLVNMWILKVFNLFCAGFLRNMATSFLNRWRWKDGFFCIGNWHLFLAW